MRKHFGGKILLQSPFPCPEPKAQQFFPHQKCFQGYVCMCAWILQLNLSSKREMKGSRTCRHHEKMGHEWGKVDKFSK